MASYYTMVILVSWMALGVLCVLVRENCWIPREDKRRFYLTYGIVALSALAEWCGIQLNGNDGVPGWLLPAVKCLDYTFTPMAGWAVVAQMKLRNRWSKALVIVLVTNALFQVIACFNHWMVVVDESYHYAHGPCYVIYIFVYMLVIFLTTAEFLTYGMSYRRQNRASLYSVLLLVVVGIALQESSGGAYRTAHLALTVGVALMFIHYSEFYQMNADEYIRMQRSQLMKDALSDVYSRHAYVKDLERYESMARLPDNLVAFSIDINELKSVNDTLGHDAGDELIVGAARCIEKTIVGSGRCYRTGGDEFVVLTRMSPEQANAALVLLEQETRQWRGEKVKKLTLSAGCAFYSEDQNLTVEKLVRQSDQAMYAAKAEYYRKNGIERRSPR